MVIMETVLVLMETSGLCESVLVLGSTVGCYLLDTIQTNRTPFHITGIIPKTHYIKHIQWFQW